MARLPARVRGPGHRRGVIFHPARRAVTKTHKAYLICQGETSDQWLIAFSAHAVDLSVWHDVHGLGMLYLSVMAGDMNRKVWA